MILQCRRTAEIRFVAGNHYFRSGVLAHQFEGTCSHRIETELLANSATASGLTIAAWGMASQERKTAEGSSNVISTVKGSTTLMAVIGRSTASINEFESEGAFKGEFHILGVKRRAVVEHDIGPQGEGIGQAVVGDSPALCKATLRIH